MRKTYQLYNVMFPVWFLIALPATWIFVLPLNFIFDSIVLILVLKAVSAKDTLQLYKKTICKVWIFGFIADFFGSLFMYLSQIVTNRWWMDNIGYGVAFNPFENIYSFIYVLCCVIISGITIFILDYLLVFKILPLDRKKILILCLSLAILTAPHTFFFFPSILLYM